MKTVKTNLYSLVQEWKDLQHVFSKPPSACPEIDSYLQPQDEIDDASSVAAEKNISGSAVDTVADLVSNTIATGEGCTSVIDTSSSTGDAVGLDNPVDTVDAAYSDKMDTTNAFSTDELDSLNAGTGNKIMQILGDYKGEGDSEVHNTGMTMSNAPVSIQVSTTTSNSATCHNSLPPRSTKTTDFSLIVQVHKSDLDRLATEALMLKELLPTVLNNFYVSCVHKVPVLEKRLEKMSEEKERLVRECNKLCRQNYALMADCEQERKEQYAAKVLLYKKLVLVPLPPLLSPPSLSLSSSLLPISPPSLLSPPSLSLLSPPSLSPLSSPLPPSLSRMKPESSKGC